MPGGSGRATHGAVSGSPGTPADSLAPLPGTASTAQVDVVDVVSARDPAGGNDPADHEELQLEDNGSPPPGPAHDHDLDIAAACCARGYEADASHGFALDPPYQPAPEPPLPPMGTQRAKAAAASDLSRSSSSPWSDVDPSKADAAASGSYQEVTRKLQERYQEELSRLVEGIAPHFRARCAREGGGAAFCTPQADPGQILPSTLRQERVMCGSGALPSAPRKPTPGKVFDCSEAAEGESLEGLERRPVGAAPCAAVATAAAAGVTDSMPRLYQPAPSQLPLVSRFGRKIETKIMDRVQALEAREVERHEELKAAVDASLKELAQGVEGCTRTRIPSLEATLKGEREARLKLEAAVDARLMELTQDVAGYTQTRITSLEATLKGEMEARLKATSDEVQALRHRAADVERVTKTLGEGLERVTAAIESNAANAAAAQAAGLEEVKTLLVAMTASAAGSYGDRDTGACSTAAGAGPPAPKPVSTTPATRSLGRGEPPVSWSGEVDGDRESEATEGDAYRERAMLFDPDGEGLLFAVLITTQFAGTSGDGFMIHAPRGMDSIREFATQLPFVPAIEAMPDRDVKSTLARLCRPLGRTTLVTLSEPLGPEDRATHASGRPISRYVRVHVSDLARDANVRDAFVSIMEAGVDLAGRAYTPFQYTMTRLQSEHKDARIRKAAAKLFLLLQGEPIPSNHDEEMHRRAISRLSDGGGDRAGSYRRTKWEAAPSVDIAKALPTWLLGEESIAKWHSKLCAMFAGPNYAYAALLLQEWSPIDTLFDALLSLSTVDSTASSAYRSQVGVAVLSDLRADLRSQYPRVCCTAGTPDADALEETSLCTSRLLAGLRAAYHGCGIFGLVQLEADIFIRAVELRDDPDDDHIYLRVVNQRFLGWTHLWGRELTAEASPALSRLLRVVVGNLGSTMKARLLQYINEFLDKERSWCKSEEARAHDSHVAERRRSLDVIGAKIRPVTTTPRHARLRGDKWISSPDDLAAVPVDLLSDAWTWIVQRLVGTGHQYPGSSRQDHGLLAMDEFAA